MIFSDQHCVVLTPEGEEYMFGIFDDATDSAARRIGGYIVQVNSEPEHVFADYREHVPSGAASAHVPPPPEWIATVADNIMSAIHADMRTPDDRGLLMPADVGSAGALHDFTDANWYYACYIVPEPQAECSCSWNNWTHSPSCATQASKPAWWPESMSDGILASGSDEDQEYSAFLYNLVSDEVDRRLRQEAEEIKNGQRTLHPDERLWSDPDIQDHLTGRYSDYMDKPEIQERVYRDEK